MSYSTYIDNIFDLNGRFALVTGAAGILGVEHSAALLECGASVILTDVSERQLLHAKSYLQNEFPSSQIITYQMDVSSLKAVHSVQKSLSDLGILVNILVNNAAIDPKVESQNTITELSRLENFPVEQWDLEISVGLTGAFLCSKVFGIEMAKSGVGGVILNIASDLSVFAPDQRLYKKDGLPDDMQPVKPVTYSVIKTGLIGLTRYLATYWADQNVRCNALSPGGVFNGQSKDFVQKLSQLIPLARMADRSEYRAAVQFLCSDASRYMTGQNIVIDGGRSVL